MKYFNTHNLVLPEISMKYFYIRLVNTQAKSRP